MWKQQWSQRTTPTQPIQRYRYNNCSQLQNGHPDRDQRKQRLAMEKVRQRAELETNMDG
jgi:hypothetical protein